MEGWIVFLSFIAGWIGFAVWARRSKKWSKTIAVGGGFIVGCLALGIASGMLLQKKPSNESAAPEKQLSAKEQDAAARK